MAAIELPRMPLAVALSGLTIAEGLREQIAWAAGQGFRGVQINAAARGSRPRDLGRSARRDLASVLRRHELVCAGVDLWVPPTHFTEPAYADRAVEAATGAIGLARELAPLTSGSAALSLVLPDAGADGVVIRRTLGDRAQGAGVRVADFRWPPEPFVGEPDSPIGVGVDPASVLMAAAPSGNAEWTDPAAAVARLGPRLAAVRLSDAVMAGRVVPGTGRLDLLAYLAATATNPGAGMLVLDLRGIEHQDAAAAQVVKRCGLVAGAA